jgi:hypothetical protein
MNTEAPVGFTWKKRFLTWRALPAAYFRAAAWLPRYLWVHIAGSFPAAHRERWQLALTEVNDCRHCRWIHTGFLEFVAGKGGADLPQDDPGLHLARAFGENDGKIDAAWMQAAGRAFGDKTRDFRSLMEVMHVANCSGNAIDAGLLALKGVRHETTSRPAAVVVMAVTLVFGALPALLGALAHWAAGRR